jgi:site-specific DNA-methyltransferase (adenine-specific)
MDIQAYETLITNQLDELVGNIINTNPKLNIAVKKGYTVCSLDSESEAKNLATYLKTSLCRFIHLKTKTSRSLRTPQLKFIPKVDLTKSWTDKELYKHFKLSQEEIDYVESSIK